VGNLARPLAVARLTHRHPDGLNEDNVPSEARTRPLRANPGLPHRYPTAGLHVGAHGLLPHIIRRWYEERNTAEAFAGESMLSWSDYRRALRAVFHAVKASRARRLADGQILCGVVPGFASRPRTDRG